MLLKRKGMKGISVSKFATICSVLVYNHHFFYSEPPVSDEAVSRKPYPHVRIFQNSMPLQIFIVAVSNPSDHNVHRNCENHNFCWWDLHSRSSEVNMFFICTQHESRFWYCEIIKHLSQIMNLLLLFASYTTHTHNVLS